jgi:hypothetical protein
MEKTCKLCGETKPISDFYLNKKYHGKGEKYLSSCKKCVIERSRQSYLRRRESVCSKLKTLKVDNPDRWVETRDAARKRRDDLAISLKSGKPCVDCSGIFHFAAMDFDHIDPNTKTLHGHSLLSFSKAKVAEEIKKCELVCANCHRIRTYNRNQERIKDEREAIRSNSNGNR